MRLSWSGIVRWPFYNGGALVERSALPNLSSTGDPMPDTRDPQSVADAAAQAAAAGDYASAEQLLREVVEMQEATLGPLHPDLANTLNNLGVVCEITEKPAEAEHCFQRAYEIATAVLEPGHPFVATSHKNLEDFRAARQPPVDSASPPSVPDERDARPTPADDLPAGPPPFGESRAESRRETRPLAIGALIVGGLLVGAIGAGTWLRSRDEVAAPRNPSVSQASPAGTAGSPAASQGAADASKETGTKSSDPVRVETKPEVTATPTATARRVPDASSSPRQATERPTTQKAAAPPLLVVSAQLCRDLSTSGQWRCVPPAVPADPGPFFFYTRLKSPTAVSVQHRWYRGDRLHQVVELSILPNTSEGYRTYSRNTIAAGGSGDWRVELRTKDGVLLHEERFVVR
jgi:hypothetical protein